MRLAYFGETKEVETKNYTNAKGDDVSYKLTKDKSNKTSFVELQKAGIERTKYDINGFSELDSNDEKKVKYVTGMSEGVSIVTNENGSVDFTVRYAAYNAYTGEYAGGDLKFTVSASTLGFKKR